MRSGKGAWVACVLALVFCLGGGCGVAQTVPRTGDASEDPLRAMSQIAGVIFAGQVIGVRLHDGIYGAAGVVEIEFAVEDAVRGVSGARYTLREWAGLWPAGDQPFRVGQRYLMLLRAPGASGLSSPVGGTDGAIPIRGGGQAEGPLTSGLAATHLPGPMAAGASAQTDGWMVDLRWVGTRAVLPLSYRPETVARPTAWPISVHANSRNAGHAYAAELASAASASIARGVDVSVAPMEAAMAPAAQDTAYTTVLGMLRSWVKDDHAER